VRQCKSWTTPQGSQPIKSLLFQAPVETAVSAPKQRKKRKTRVTKQLSLRRNGLGYNAQWDFMVSRLGEFRKVHGHTIVSRSDDPDLYRWTQSVRKNYDAPAEEFSVFEATADAKNNTNETSKSRWTTSPPSSESKSFVNRRTLPRHTLPRLKMIQLQKLDFCWDVQEAIWDRRYAGLESFHKEHGHCVVPMCNPGGLGVWVKNQRREYRNLEAGDHSTLTRDRLEKLHALSFKFSRSRKELWEEKYQDLLAFYRKHGHSNVPGDYADNQSLGAWCMNQRTAYRRHLERGLSDDEPRGTLTREKVQLLQDVNFAFNFRQAQWQKQLDRVQTYYKQHGHISIPSYDTEHRDMRLWLLRQRYNYNLERRLMKQQERNIGGNVKSPLTEERIDAIEEAIPNFQWKLYDGKGPSREDWEDLFHAMREKGIQPGMRPKQHWFEGEKPLNNTIKDVWTEKDLLELWNQEDEDDEFDFAYDNNGNTNGVGGETGAYDMGR